MLPPVDDADEASATRWNCTIAYQSYAGFEPNRIPLPELDSHYEVTFGNDDCWTAISDTGKAIERFTPEQQRQLEDSYASARLQSCL